jgi:phosphinothricin acetyltransferase
VAEVVLREFRWSDVPAVTAIYRHAVEHTVATFDLEAPGETVLAEKFGHIRELGHPLIMAEQDGACVGYAYASTYRPRPAYRFTCEDSVYLAPELQGQGIGSRLLGALIEASRSCGFKQMIAVITAERANSIRLHEKHGFAMIGRHPQLGFKFDRWLDIVHMQKTL